MDALTRDIPTRMRIDPWLVTAAVCFVIAVAAAAYPAFRHDPWSAPGLILIVTLAAVALMGVFAFGRADAGERRRAAGDAAVDLLDALAEPAALVWSGGRVLAFNAAWTEAGGATTALPSGRSASSLYMAFAQARGGEPGRAMLRIGERDVEVLIGAAGDGRFLVRQAPESVLARPRPGPARPRAGGARPGTAAPWRPARPSGPPCWRARTCSRARSRRPIPPWPADRPGGRARRRLRPPVRCRRAWPRRASASPRDRPAPSSCRLARSRTACLHLYVAPEGEGRRIWLFDVSEQKQIELQLAQAQKMQAIGQLAGGVAHDFNNLLTAIQLQLDELLQRHPVGDPSYEGLNEIRQTASRAADLVRKLLAFSRKQTVQRETPGPGRADRRVRGPAAPPAARGRQAGDRLRPRPAAWCAPTRASSRPR